MIRVNKKGFTLVETIIALVFFGFLLLAAIYAETIAIHQEYLNTDGLVAEQVLDYEVAYAHSWANKGNVHWGTGNSQEISCSPLLSSVSGSFGAFEGPVTNDCLGLSQIFSALNVPNGEVDTLYNGSNSQKPMQIFLYIHPITNFTSGGYVPCSSNGGSTVCGNNNSSYSCQMEIEAYVFWYYNLVGDSSNSEVIPTISVLGNYYPYSQPTTQLNSDIAGLNNYLHTTDIITNIGCS